MFHALYDGPVDIVAFFVSAVLFGISFTWGQRIGAKLP